MVSSKAKFASAFIRFGLVPDGGSTRTLQRLVGRGRGYEMMATGRALNAEEALSWGIANRLVEPGQVLEVTCAWAAELAAGPRRAVGRVKQLLSETSVTNLDEALEREREAQAACLKDAEFQEGLDARLNRRDPDFKDL